VKNRTYALFLFFSCFFENYLAFGACAARRLYAFEFSLLVGESYLFFQLQSKNEFHQN